MSALNKYNDRADKINSLLSVGLDSNFHELPEHFRSEEQPQFEFNRHIISQTAEFAAAYKFNMAFYEARGTAGYNELKQTLELLEDEYPDIFRICDAKRGDTENTNQAYVESIFDWFNFDAVTLNPYMGSEPLQPFLDRKDKTSIILCRTSNPGAAEIQDLQIDGKPLWHHIAQKVKSEWNANDNCMLVVGATYPEEMKTIREIAGDMTFLVPGVGSQGGDVEKMVRAGLNKNKKGIIVNASRSVIFSENPGEEAKKLRDLINSFR